LTPEHTNVLPTLRVEHLGVDIHTRSGVVRALDDVSFAVAPGETLGIVGESGCGKTMSALAVLGLLPSGARITTGSIKVGETELVGAPETVLRSVRGARIGMIFQDPMTSLNPSKTIGWQIAEPLVIHGLASRKEAMARALEVLELVRIPSAKQRLADYPHQLSGGMRQRVMIAIALSCRPELVIADEPTTALDVTIQAQILGLLDELKAELGMGLVLVTHDLGVVAGRADRVMVMYAGSVVEEADTYSLFERTSHPYTRALLGSIPRIGDDRDRPLAAIPGMPPDLINLPRGCRFADRCSFAASDCLEARPRLEGTTHRVACYHPVGTHQASLEELAPHPRRQRSEEVLLEVQGLHKSYDVYAGALRRRVGTLEAVAGVDLVLRRGETLGIVGESGCGKSTLARLMVGLERPTSGRILLSGKDLASLRGRDLRRAKRLVQLMFQDPYASLDPRMRVRSILLEPAKVQHLGTAQERERRMEALLDEVGLRSSALERYPHEFSGGQRQRIGFARALMLEPQLVVADEPVSALDVSIRSQVLNLMRRMQATHGLTYVLISHDLSVVSYLSDRVGVMYLGEIVELADAELVFERPAHPYTQGLLRSIPVPDPRIERAKGPTAALAGELPSPLSPPAGCRFHPRCPFAVERCRTEHPVLRDLPDGGQVACHRAEEVIDAAGAGVGIGHPVRRRGETLLSQEGLS